MSYEFSFEWSYSPSSPGDCYATCTLNYIPECRGFGSHPDAPEDVELLDVTIAGQSIYTLLNDDHIAQIEMLALERHGADLVEMASERSIERYQERRAA